MTCADLASRRFTRITATYAREVTSVQRGEAQHSNRGHRHLLAQSMSPDLSLVQPCGLERLVDVSPFAPDGFSDLSGAHSFLAQGDNARAVESDGPALVNPLRLCCVDASALAVANEAELHLATHPQDGQDHPAHRPAGVDGRLQHPQARSFFLQLVNEIEDVPRIS